MMNNTFCSVLAAIIRVLVEAKGVEPLDLCIANAALSQLSYAPTEARTGGIMAVVLGMSIPIPRGECDGLWIFYHWAGIGEIFVGKHSPYGRVTMLYGATGHIKGDFGKVSPPSTAHNQTAWPQITATDNSNGDDTDTATENGNNGSHAKPQRTATATATDLWSRARLTLVLVTHY